MPAGIEFAVAGHTGPVRPLPKTLQFLQSRHHFLLNSNDAHQLLHCFLEIALHGIRIFAGGPLKGRDSFRSSTVDLIAIDSPKLVLLREFRRVFPRAFPENHDIGERIAAQPIGAVDAGCALASRKQPGDARHLRVWMDMDPTHRVMRSRPNFHRLLGDVDIRQLFELVIHARQLLFDVLGRVRQFLFDPGDIEIDPAMRRSPALFYLANNATGHVITRK